VVLGDLFAGQSDSFSVLVGGANVETLVVDTKGPVTAVVSPVTDIAGVSGAIAVTAIAPKEPGTHEGLLTIRTLDDSLKPVTVSLVLTTIPTPPVPEDGGIALKVIEGGHSMSADGATFNYALEVRATAPMPVSDGPVVLAVTSIVKEGVAVTFSTKTVSVVTREIVPVTIFVPQDVGKLAGQTMDLTLGGTVTFGGREISLISVPISIPTGMFFMAPPPPPCACPVGTPASTLNNALANKSFQVPDAAPPVGMTPGANPVATVKVEIKGPKMGECCQTGDRKFEMTLTVDSMVGGVNNTTTSAFLGAFPLNATTNGVAQPIVNGPNNNPAPAVQRAERVTKADEAISCGPPGCLATVANANHVTKFIMGGAGAGSAEVHWTVSIATNNADCVVTAVTGTVDRVIYTRNAQVYDPNGDRMLNKGADTDGDGTNNYDEVSGGFNPGDAASHP